MSNPSLANLNAEQVHASKQKALAKLMQGVRKVGKGVYKTRLSRRKWEASAGSPSTVTRPIDPEKGGRSY